MQNAVHQQELSSSAMFYFWQKRGIFNCYVVIITCPCRGLEVLMYGKVILVTILSQTIQLIIYQSFCDGLFDSALLIILAEDRVKVCQM